MKSSLAKAATQARRVTYRTRGHSHGPITRLVSPSDVGELIKPFVFLDYFEIDPKNMPAIGFHPHSGIATLSLIFEGQITYEETSGTKGIIEPGGVEWMRASGGVWHTGGAVGTARVKGYQLWIALPPEMESMEPEAQYLGGERFRSHGPARVILGRLGEAASEVPARRVASGDLDRETRGAAHQGVVADLRAGRSFGVEDLVNEASGAPLIVVLDEIERWSTLGGLTPEFARAVDLFQRLRPR